MDLPPEDTLRWLVARYAHMRAEFGEFLDDAKLVQPDESHFPDEIKLDPDGIGTLFRRVLSYLPVADDVEFELAFVESEGAARAGGCGTGACGTGGTAEMAHGTVVDLGDRYGVAVPIACVSDPVLLTAALARAAGSVLLFEAGEEPDPGELGALSEIAAAAAGLGVLLASGAAHYKKGCGGMRVHRGTHLAVEETAIALALFVRAHDVKTSEARRHLEATQREAFDEALRWVDSNPEIVTALRETPQMLVDGVFQIQETKSVLGRLLARRKVQAVPADAPISRAKRERSPEEERRLAEARALVEEALK